MTVNTLNFDKITTADLQYIDAIADKVVDYADRVVPMGRHGLKKIHITMDLIAVHVNGCPLFLATMAKTARMGDLLHDVMGIRRHLNRGTGKLENCFWPRFAEKQ